MLRLLVVRAVVDLHDVACILLFVLGDFVLRFRLLAGRAWRLVGSHCTFHHGVDLLEREVGICINLPEPIKLPVMHEENEVEVALVRYLNGLLDQVFGSAVLGVRQISSIIGGLLWLICAHLDLSLIHI